MVAMAVTAHDDEAVARLRRFVAGHAGVSVAVVEHLGRAGARIVVIAESGEFGDVLASSPQAAQDICARGGLEVREWDRELTALISPTPADRVTMGRRQR
jgi:shikimate 5-dehydrogenase